VILYTETAVQEPELIFSAIVQIQIHLLTEKLQLHAINLEVKTTSNLSSALKKKQKTHLLFNP